MKKILKSCLLMLVAVCVSFSFVGCKKKVSPTTTDTGSIKLSNGVTTNGGMTVVRGEYMYFINGTKANDGKSQDDNTRSAICRVKYDIATGKTSGDMEVVVDELVGFSDGSLYIFGDYLYYTTPSDGENSNGDVLYNKTVFKRYDLVNEKSYTIYTTELNSSSEVMNYAYYIVGDSLNLLVFEKSNATIKSFKIDKKVVENYTISEVTGCLFSENTGKVTTGAAVDANSYVFYTKTPATNEEVQTGNKVYKTSPVKDNGVLISEGREISLLTIRAGKLIYSVGEFIYADTITSGKDTLKVDNTNCISRATLENAIYIENYSLKEVSGKKHLVKTPGSISILTMTKATDTASYIDIFEWTSTSNGPEDNSAQIGFMSSATDFNFIGLVELEEVVTEDDEKTTDVNEEVKRKVLYAFFMESSLVYKIEIAEVKDENTMVVSSSERIKLSTSKVSKNDGLLVGEIVGNYMFILSEDKDKNVYLVKIDVTPTKNATKEADKFALEEK